MEFRIKKSSDWEYEDYIEIKTLEELLKFQEKCNCNIIINGDEIEIYDDYRE